MSGVAYAKQETAPQGGMLSQCEKKRALESVMRISKVLRTAGALEPRHLRDASHGSSFLIDPFLKDPIHIDPFLIDPFLIDPFLTVPLK